MKTLDAWWFDVFNALVDLKGAAYLYEIYPIVYQARKARSATLGEHEAWIRNALQGNSRGKGHNLFVHIARGRWGVRAMLK